jgi:hypothetical protein
VRLAAAKLPKISQKNLAKFKFQTLVKRPMELIRKNQKSYKEKDTHATTFSFFFV